MNKSLLSIRIIVAVGLTSLMLYSCSQSSNCILKTEKFAIRISPAGYISSFRDLLNDSELIAVDTLAPLLSIQVKGVKLMPEKFAYSNDTAELYYNSDLQAIVLIKEHQKYLSFELLEVKSRQPVDLVIWGPYPTTLNQVIGETVGVVQGEKFAIGLQALNPKTLGGYPWHNDDSMPQIDIFEQDDYTDVSEQGKREVLYRVEAAKPAAFGSSLQAYCRNRDKDRTISAWNHDHYVAPAYDDGGVIGSKIAMFGVSRENVLETIGEIEVAEGLPHPIVDGEWGKTSRTASASYLIMDFGEDDIIKALDVVEKAGLRYLDHPGPFTTWGHFELNKQKFPNGIEGMKKCVEIAESKGVFVGAHTLSNFITTNDLYVTPIPDQRLAKVGCSVLTSDIDAVQTTIVVDSPTFFNQYRNNHLKTVQIGNELIRYEKVSEASPYVLTNCQRGAFGTNADRHTSGSKICKLADHAYNVFLTNAELSIEVAENIADVFNTAGLRQISFDGLEGNRSTGMGNYGEILFTNAWYNGLNEDIKEHFIADASRTSHFFWHLYSRMNWGEPWYAGFRESQTEYRLKNQKYFKRNLMPGMLGWFKMTPETSIEDTEWLLALSAGYDAGFAFVASFESLEKNGYSDRILNQIKEWENARLSGAFTEEQKQQMQENKKEYNLIKLVDRKWDLVKINSYIFTHNQKVLQPGEPLYSEFEYENNGPDQTVELLITAKESDVNNIELVLDNFKSIKINRRIKAGETLKYKSGDTAVIYDSNWKQIGTIPLNPEKFTISNGTHVLKVDCNFKNSKENAALKLEVRLIENTNIIFSKN